MPCSWLMQLLKYQYPSFKEISMIIQYAPALKHLMIPFGGSKMLQLFLSFSQNLNANIAICTLKCYNMYAIEVEFKINGNPWSVQIIEEMNQNMESEYKLKQSNESINNAA